MTDHPVDSKATVTPRTRSAQKRMEMRAALIIAAERRVAESGMANLRARDLAQDIGIALGAIYNLVADLDELMFLVIARTLARLDTALEIAATTALAGAEIPTKRLVTIANAYLEFARANERVWRSIFEFRLPDGKELPELLTTQHERLFRHILKPLDQLLPTKTPRDRQIFAQTLFTATHGIVQLSLEQRLFAVPPEAIEGQLEMFVSAVCAGIVVTDREPVIAGTAVLPPR